MADDYYTLLAQQRFAELDAAEVQCRANLAATYAQGGDTVADSQNVQMLANIRAEKQALAQLAQEHVAFQMAPSGPAPLTREEWEVLPVEKMNAARDSAYLATRGTRWEGTVRNDDPNVQAAYHRLWREKQGG